MVVLGWDDSEWTLSVTSLLFQECTERIQIAQELAKKVLLYETLKEC